MKFLFFILFAHSSCNKTIISRLSGQIIRLLVVFGAVGCSVYDDPILPDVKSFAGVSGDEPRSVIEARRVLKRGGTAADAATAMYFVLSVNLPSAASLGGGGVCLVFRPKSKKEAESIEVLEFFTKASIDNSLNSVRPSAVPGNPMGIYALHSRYGQLQWGELVIAGERLARFGSEMSSVLLRDYKVVENALLEDKESQKIFLGKNMEKPRVGDVLVQKDLANSLSLIRSKGAKYFYGGEFAERLVRQVRKIGGTLSLEDLSNYKPRWVNTVSMYFGGDFFRKHRAHFAPPPATSGIVRAHILGMLERSGSETDSQKENAYHQMLRSSQIAFGNRNKWMKPDFTSNFSEKTLLSENYIDELWNIGNGLKHIPTRTLFPSSPARPENPSATSFVIVDKWGMSVSCEFTMNNNFGIGRVAPGTGIMMAATPLGVGRGSLSLGPMMIINQHSSQLLLAASSSGGVASATSLAWVVANAYLTKEELHKSMNKARVHHSAVPDKAYFESGVGKNIKSSLQQKGHYLASTNSIGKVNIIYCSDGLPRAPETCDVQTDSRGDGMSLSIIEQD